ncbi:MAG: DedA family protein [Nanoarchaeota archaeon]|nr:DedA family protein [Nanoarchaeota archaeon]
MGLFTVFLASIEAFVQTYGLGGTFIISLFESFIFPVPTAVIIAPTTAFGQDPLLTVLVATVGSVIGAVVGYVLGMKLGHPIAHRLFKKKHLDRVEQWFERWGVWTVLLAAFSPIPFKVVTVASGIFRLSFRGFILAAIVGRFFQFLVAAYVGDIFGAAVIGWLGSL